jgi:hypothetical protein
MSVARNAARLGRHLPAARLIVAAELLMMARQHLTMLEPQERRRFVELVRHGRGRRRNLTPSEREELAGLIAKVGPREFAGEVAERLSPVPLPKRLVEGRRRQTKSKR